MNLKLDLSMVNTILMVVVLILVIVACVRRYRENFDTCHIPCNADGEGVWDEGDKGFKCDGSGRCGDVGSADAGGEWQNLDGMKDLKEWAQSDDGIHNSWVYGESRINIQLEQSAYILFNILDRILKALNVEGDSAANAIEKVKNASKQFVEDDDDGNKDYSKPNLQTLKHYIKSSGNYDHKAKGLILKLKKSDDAVKKLIKLEETTDGEIDNDTRDQKQKHWEELLEGVSDTYKITDNGEQINFLEQLSKLIDEEQLLIDFVNKIINKLGTKHKAIALGTIGVIPTTQA